MKAKYIIPAAIIALLGAGMTSCSDMLETKTESFVDIDGLGGYDTNDARYSAMGIVSQIQKLGERYVLLGELRGDLVDVPATASSELQEIASFSPSADNSYSSRRDYYSVINNCNFALTKLDTLLVERNEKVLLPEYISIRTMRAWTYLQLGLTYGKAAWITEPLLSLEATEEEHEMVSLDNLIDRLIDELTPYAGGETIAYGTVDNKPSHYFIIPPELLLADLYLYQNRYEEAAALYHLYMTEHDVTMTGGYSNQWENVQQLLPSELSFLLSYQSETIAMIPYAEDAKEYHTNLVNLTYNTVPQLTPARWWMNEMNSKEHYYSQSEEIPTYSVLTGDTRGEMVPATAGHATEPVSFSSNGLGSLTTQPLICKFALTSTINSEVSNPNNPIFENGGQLILNWLAIYRYSHLYLRYAEAINRAGKPTMAFAVLKYGLRNEVVNNEVDPKIDPEEWEGHETWLNFEDAVFDRNRGTAARGRGLGVSKATEYVIPEGLSKEEQIAWVEEQILEEMAAETAFEGNRFFDLLRMSRHQTEGDKWFATKVCRRFADPASAEARLADRNNWWLK
jgi:hypothetical protein